MVHRSRRQTNRDLRYLIQRSFEECPDFGDRIQVDGKINRIAEGIWHDNYWFFIRGPDLPAARTEQGYVLRLVQQQHDWQRVPESRDRLVREAETLQALMTSDFALLTPEFICFVMDEKLTQPIGMIETAVSGVSLDRFKDRSTLKRISKVAAHVHRMKTECFLHLPKSNTRAQHIQLRLEELDEDLFAEFFLAEQVRDWIASHLPSDDHTCVLHGDLLPQNVLYDWQSGDPEGLVAVVDWEMAQIGDPAYDLAIVSRGNRKVHGVPDGLKLLLHDYVEFGGRKILLTDVRAHELILLLQWLEESWREQQKPTPSGHGPGFYESKLKSLFRRTVSCSVR